MKKTSIAVLSLLLISGTTTFGQGTLFFANRLSVSTFSVVYGTDGTTPLNASYSAQLFANTGGTFNPVGSVVTFRTGGGQGSWAGITEAIPGAIAGTSVQLQVYAWFNGGQYATYAAALAAGVATGFSPAFTSAPLGGDPGGGGLTIPDPNIVGNAAPINNMQSFKVNVPEPSTIALGVLGAAALLFRRRR